MVNLINQKQKKILQYEYIYRLLAVILLMISVVGLFVLAYIIPYFLSVLNNDIIVSQQLQAIIQVENKENVGENVNQVVLKTNEQIKGIENLIKNFNPVSDIVVGLVGYGNSDLNISRLAIKAVSPGVNQIFISGVAADRQSLVFLISALKNKSNFNNVESPISDFAKQSNIPFTISLKNQI